MAAPRRKHFDHSITAPRRQSPPMAAMSGLTTWLAPALLSSGTAAAARPPVYMTMAAWTKSLNFTAVTPAFVRGRRSGSPIWRFVFRLRAAFCRARSVPRAISRSRGSDIQLRAPIAASPTTPRLPTGIAYCPERYTSSGVRILSSGRQFCRPGPLFEADCMT